MEEAALADFKKHVARVDDGRVSRRHDRLGLGHRLGARDETRGSVFMARVEPLVAQKHNARVDDDRFDVAG